MTHGEPAIFKRVIIDLILSVIDGNTRGILVTDEQKCETLFDEVDGGFFFFFFKYHNLILFQNPS